MHSKRLTKEGSYALEWNEAERTPLEERAAAEFGRPTQGRREAAADPTPAPSPEAQLVLVVLVMLGLCQ